jgi:hypothetical protein
VCEKWFVDSTFVVNFATGFDQHQVVGLVDDEEGWLRRRFVRLKITLFQTSLISRDLF